jgi:hypothetical protein
MSLIIFRPFKVKKEKALGHGLEERVKHRKF